MARKKQAFGGTFLSVPIGISGLGLQFQVYIKRKKNREVTPVSFLGAKVPRQSTFFPPFRVFLCLLYIKLPGILAVLSGRAKEKYVCFNFLEREVQKIVF